MTAWYVTGGRALSRPARVSLDRTVKTGVVLMTANGLHSNWTVFRDPARARQTSWLVHGTGIRGPTCGLDRVMRPVRALALPPCRRPASRRNGVENLCNRHAGL